MDRKSTLRVAGNRASISTHTILSFNEGAFGERTSRRDDSYLSEYIEKALILGDALRRVLFNGESFFGVTSYEVKSTSVRWESWESIDTVKKLFVKSFNYRNRRVAEPIDRSLGIVEDVWWSESRDVVGVEYITWLILAVESAVSRQGAKNNRSTTTKAIQKLIFGYPSI